MSYTLTVNAKDFVALLSVLAETAYKKDDIPDYNSVYLAVTEGEYGDEPGKQTLLAGYSITLNAAGHTFMPAVGTLGNNVIAIPLDDVKTITSVFSKRVKANKENEDYSLTLTYDGERQTLTVGEYVDSSFDDSPFSITVVQCPDGAGIVHQIKEFLSGAGVKLDMTTVDGDVIDDNDATVWDSASLALLSAIGRKTKCEVHVFQTGHTASTHLAESGVEGVQPFWRGAISPVATVADNDPIIPVM